MKSAFWTVLLLSGTVLSQGAQGADRLSFLHSMGGTNQWGNTNPAPVARQDEDSIQQLGHLETGAVVGHTDSVVVPDHGESAPLPPTVEGQSRPIEKPFGELPGQMTASRTPEERVSWTAPAVAAEEKIRRVKSRHLVFNYKLQKVGPSGVVGAELWYTRDGQNWEKAPSGIQPQGSYQVDVSEDGLYGFTLLAKTGFGGGKEPPKKGDPAQVWVEVDTLKPVVALTGIKPMGGGRTLLINWKANDKNLSLRPINLYYLDLNTGQNVPIAMHVENTETYTWQVPAGTPNNLRIRIEAIDKSGNLGADETPNPVQLDLSQPEITDISVNTSE